MKISVVLAALISLAPLSLSSTSAFSAESSAPAVIDNDMVLATYALSNITDKALDLATQYSWAPGIQGTPSGHYLGDLIQDTNALKHAVQRLAQLLESNGSKDAIQSELNIIETKYQAVNRGSSRVSTQLYSQSKTSEGYQLRSAYVKIRSRYVYLQAQLAE